jgi:alcohol dehydrogenase (nicotinoprotein)
MKTRAAVLRDVGKDWEVIELDLDPPREGEVLIRFAAAGLCHSDDHLRTGDIPVRYPIVGGSSRATMWSARSCRPAGTAGSAPRA